MRVQPGSRAGRNLDAQHLQRVDALRHYVVTYWPLHHPVFGLLVGQEFLQVTDNPVIPEMIVSSEICRNF